MREVVRFGRVGRRRWSNHVGAIGLREKNPTQKGLPNDHMVDMT